MRRCRKSSVRIAVLFCATALSCLAAAGRAGADDHENSASASPKMAVTTADPIKSSETLIKPGHTRNRPRIGLVLGGGGSRGYAHIGVIQWLEEHRIPVDCIAGTSIGGLVGGAYAADLSPEEICHLINSMDCDQILSGDPPYAQASIRRKEDRRSHPGMVELGTRGGLKLPSGLSPAQPIGFVISRICLPYGALSDFDDLPIPFRCVVVDMEAGEQVILKDGSMGLAMRATMAYPGVFTPVERNGRLLADGGLLNVVPTDVAKAMGADVTIAVNVSTPLEKRESFDTLTGMIDQALCVTIANNARRNMRLADVKLEPDLGNYTCADFCACDAIAQLGYQCAARHAGELERFALPEAQWQQYLAERHARRMRATLTPAFLEVEGVGPAHRDTIQRHLSQYCGKPLDLARLEADLLALTGEGRLESVRYESARRGDRNGLRICLKEKPHGPSFVRPAIEINNSDSGHIAFNLPARLTAFDVGGYGGELRADVCLGTRNTLAAEYFRPISSQGWFVAPHILYDRNTQGLFGNGARIADYTTSEVGAGFDIGAMAGRHSEVRLGYEIGRIATSVGMGAAHTAVPGGATSAASLRWTFDGQDSAMVPTRGTRAVTSARWFLQSPDGGSFPVVETNISTFKPVSKRGSVFAMASGGTTLGHKAPVVQQFTLGGPLRLGAYGANEISGSSYLLGGIGYLHQMGDLPPLLGNKVYLGSWYEVGGASDSFRSLRTRNSLSVALIAETRLGPIALGGSVGDRMRSRLFFSLGRLF
jgi:NTE family protein